MTFAERLKYARQLRQLTQKQLARRAGISQQAVHDLESGRHKTSRQMVQIANALRVRPEWLAKEQLPMEPVVVGTQALKFGQMIEQLHPEHQAYLEAVIKAFAQLEPSSPPPAPPQRPRRKRPRPSETTTVEL
jgi:transcriptional regulator with XRE-family HTH domain